MYFVWRRVAYHLGSFKRRLYMYILFHEFLEIFPAYVSETISCDVMCVNIVSEFVIGSKKLTKKIAH